MSQRLWCWTFLLCSSVSVVTTSILLYYGLFLPTFHPNRQLGAMPPFYSSAFLPIFAASNGQKSIVPPQVSIAPSTPDLKISANLTVHCNESEGTCKSGKEGDGRSNGNSFGGELKNLNQNWQVKSGSTSSKSKKTRLRFRQSTFKAIMANHHQNGTLSAVANSTWEAVSHFNRTQAALKLATLKEYLFMVLLTDAIFSAWAVLCLFVLLFRRWYQQMDEIEVDDGEDSEDKDEGFGSREDLEAGNDGRGNRDHRQRIPVQLIVDGGHDQVALQIEEGEGVNETDSEEFDEEEEEEEFEDEDEEFEDEEEEDFEDSSWDEGFYDEEFESENFDEEGDDEELDEQGENEHGVVPPLPLPPLANQFPEAEPNRALPFALPFGRRLDWMRLNYQPRPIMV